MPVRPLAIVTSANSSFDYSPLRERLKVPTAWEDPPLPLEVDDLPPLPIINNRKLKEKVVTHRSKFSQPKGTVDPHKLQQEIQEGSYEVPEFMGDKHMAGCASRALLKLFPQLSPLRATELLSMVLANRTISYLALGYKLDQRLLIGKSTRENEPLSQKVCADLFEAHIGGLLLDDYSSDQCINEWLFEIFSLRVFTTLKSVVRLWMEEQHRSLSIPRGVKRKAVTQTVLFCPECTDLVPDPVSIDYTQANSREWHAVVSTRGKKRSCGSGKTKNEAHEGAMRNCLYHFAQATDS